MLDVSNLIIQGGSMPFSPAQQQLLEVPFSYRNDAHRQLLETKLTDFNQQYSALRRQATYAFMSGVGACVSRLFSFANYLLPIAVPLDWLFVGYGAIQMKEAWQSNQQYRGAFQEMLALYDWCIPERNANEDDAAYARRLPPANNELMQGFIERMGTLINNSRLQRLAPLANQQAGQSYGNYLFNWGEHALASGGQALMGLFSSQNQQPAANNYLDDAAFRVLIHNLVTGNSTSQVDYYCFGEGGSWLNRGAAMGMAAVGQAGELAGQANFMANAAQLANAAQQLAPIFQGQGANGEQQQVRPHLD